MGGSHTDLSIPSFRERRSGVFSFLYIAQTTSLPLSIVLVSVDFEPNELLDLIDVALETALLDHLSRHRLSSSRGKVKQSTETPEADVVVDLGARKKIVLHDGSVKNGRRSCSCARCRLIGCAGTVVVADRRKLVVGRKSDTRQLVGFESAFKFFDFRGTEDVIEEHLGQDVVGGELGRAFVAIEGSEYTGSIGSCRSEDATGYGCQSKLQEQDCEFGWALIIQGEDVQHVPALFFIDLPDIAEFVVSASSFEELSAVVADARLAEFELEQGLFVAC